MHQWANGETYQQVILFIGYN